MSEIADNNSLDFEDENERFDRLFPRCQPKKYGSRSLTFGINKDINLNKVEEEVELNANDTFIEDYTQHGNLTSINKSATKTYCKNDSVKTKMEEDHTVHSAYNVIGTGMHQSSTNSDDKPEYAYDDSLDIGFRMRALSNFESTRIGMAGGREKISQSRLRTTKKRHSDETVRCNPHAGMRGSNRHSGEVLFDDENKEYKLRSWSQQYVGSSKNHKTICNVAVKTEGSSRYGRAPHRLSPTSPQEEHYRKTDSSSIKINSGQLKYNSPVDSRMEVEYDGVDSLKDKIDPDVKIDGVMQSPSASSDKLQVLVKNDDDDDDSNMMQVSSSGDNTSSSSRQHSPVGRIARVIGNVPIAEYDGSPRRYGPRPGFPQRMTNSVVDDVIVDEQPNQSSKLKLSSNRFKLRKILDDGQHLETNGDGPDVISNDIDGGNNNSDVAVDCSNANDDWEEKQNDDYNEDFSDLEYKLYRLNSGSYVGKRLAQSVTNSESNDSPKKSDSKNNEHSVIGDGVSQIRIDVENDSANENGTSDCGSLHNDRNLLLLHEHVVHHTLIDDILRQNHHHLDLPDGEDVMSNSDTEDLGETEIGEQVGHSRNFTLSPETTDCDSNDLESELSAEMNDACSLEHSSNSRLYSSMPILEDGLSSGNVSEVEEVCDMDVNGKSNDNGSSSTVPTHFLIDESERRPAYPENPTVMLMQKQINEIEKEIARRTSTDYLTYNNQNVRKNNSSGSDLALTATHVDDHIRNVTHFDSPSVLHDGIQNVSNMHVFAAANACAVNREFLWHIEQENLAKNESSADSEDNRSEESVSQAIREIKEAIQHSRNIILKTPPMDKSTDEDEKEPVWVPRHQNGVKNAVDMDNVDDDIADDHHRVDEGVVEEDDIEEETDRLLGVDKQDGFDKEKGHYRRSTLRNASSVGLPVTRSASQNSNLRPKYRPLEANDVSGKKKNATNRSKEVIIHEPAVLIEGVLFRARYLGSTQLVCEGQPTKATRMMQAEEAVSRIKAPEGESQPSTDVDLFISTEKIMVLNTDLKEIMMDHALRTISYIADIGELVVLMARRRPTPGEVENSSVIHHTPKMICHVFESEEAQFIAQSIGQAFQVAYMEFLKANGIEDSSFVKEMDYQEVLNSQQIFGDELEMFAKKDKQKEVIVPKSKGEILGMVIVESGWGSMLPTVVIANMAQGGPAARCGQLNIGDQIIAINGVSLVGLPLSTCQSYIKNTRTQTVVKLTMVPCPPVVEVKIKRPDTKYQLGFSVQNGVICSLLRGGIAERGGVRVGHRIIEINGQSVVAVPHERIVNLLATSVGEINMKTMPTSMFRLLTGQDTPLYI